MSVIERSGFYQDINGDFFLVTQGGSGCTFVAGKQCLFRVYMQPSQLDDVDTVVIVISGNTMKKTTAIVVPKANIIIFRTTPDGPAVGVIVKGCIFPKAGQYNVTVSARSALGVVLAQPVIAPLVFYPTKDLRLLVVPMSHQGVFDPTQEWYKDIASSMLRLGAMFPVRDCVQSLNASKMAGLRYNVGDKCDGWTSGYEDCVYNQTIQINNSPGDHIDVTIEFRWGFYLPQYNPPGDPSPGGNSGRPQHHPNLKRASCVAGPYNGFQMTAPCFAQEIGHNFGLEPVGSPHYQDPYDPGHSKDSVVVDPFAFDFIRQTSYLPAQPPASVLGDVMNNWTTGAWQGADSVSYNAYDWEYLRQQFIQLDSTGTEKNPALNNPCDPLYAKWPHSMPPEPPSTYQHLIGSPADGRHWVWTNHGLQPIDPDNPVFRKPAQYSAAATGLKIILEELADHKVSEVYLPMNNKPLEVVAAISGNIFRSPQLL
ncbi:hypothetical protein CLV51_10892 [Chitinophaga niastensis]|uniref:Uncharacterized protein n=1 Tax=Chitinophaga niastensis TaxID=536980 RepID=A0A2P8HB04_CHINA|nr:hypothetical protein [Chitinophaga niastensis]PSL43403.1 hypothetical protein CLV51_10892 [Chitinophaga niastensis]